MRGFVEVFRVALRLGLTSFGGPAAHIGYFRTEYVERRRWLDDHAFAELVAVAQFLPGPASSQLGAAVGFARAGWPGAAGAWLGFTAPSALAMAALAALSSRVDVSGAVWLHALKLVAVAVVLDAVLSLARSLTGTVLTIGIAVVVAAAALLLPPSGLAQVLLLAGSALLAAVAIRHRAPAADDGAIQVAGSRRVGAVLLTTFVLLFAAFVVGRPLTVAHPLLDLASGMFRSGSLVFGGGHVVLPLLQAETVPRLVAPDDFLAGYGAVQAMPGPLFTFSAFLGQTAAGVVGALVACVAIFLPGMLLMFGVLPFWNGIRARPAIRAALVGANAAVVGLLAAALVDPVASSAVRSAPDLAYATVLFVLLRYRRLRPALVVALALAASPLLS